MCNNSSSSEMKASLAALEAKDGDPLKQHSAYLQQKASLQQEELQALEAKLKKATDFLKQQDKMLKESNATTTAEITTRLSYHSRKSWRCATKRTKN